MSNDKPSCQVALFPLCDPRGALSEVLNNQPKSDDTRLNALILAWRLDLPENVSMAGAATALLTVAAAQPRKQWTERQLRLVAELRRISESNGGRPRAEWQRLLKRGASSFNKASTARLKSKQRKTRTGRVIQTDDD